MATPLIVGAGVLLAVWAFFGADKLPPLPSESAVSRTLALPLNQRRASAVQVLGSCCGAALAWLVLSGQLGVLAIPAGAGFGWALIGNLLAASLEKERDAGRADFALVLDLLASTVEAGGTMMSAATHVGSIVGGPNGDALNAVASLANIGTSPETAWRALDSHPYWSNVSKELARCAHSGAASAKVLHAAASQERRTRAATLAKKVREVGVRSSLPLVLCYLPAFLLLGVVPIVGGLIGQYL